MRLLFIALLASALLACSDPKELSESERRFNRATAQHSEQVQEARILLNEKLTGDFLSDINALIYAKEKLNGAESVFVKAKIVGMSSPEAEKLKAQLRKYELEAAKTSVSLLRTAFRTTIDFQKSVHDMPLAPVSGASLGSSFMIDYMGKQFNSSLESCCLSHLKNIEIFMRGAKGDIFYTLRKRIINVESDLTRVLSDDEYQRKYKQTLLDIEKELSK
ncbi:hypothetical protein BM528_07470 [Alteromonas sp. RW2A1]|uniref:hypothetical protein n=1 Tax=Alteromonas sp. RW2A1 TaxID=1917158 RepID=UPI000903936E|nr:hypothetical protein [Alteromonas sp. RW2A1]APE05637.1 hypothetical protein BM528_07470 [Alteromonas sp. RW2A1]